ncbi:hypothetical protein [Roseospira visakhapatnamensis]|uniref:Uncharacterized protein n=1 Tax=Roseospira visakhapatnamensis TaxID=390880 RepID=A0A7W6RCW5_9PROT|nr:hypothetical protein [Roseospira visakhapatnamensis]MBB4265694.1 hypothetical protein [Roseospira visakhapatnamensis]
MGSIDGRRLEIHAILVTFARAACNAQGVARRLGYLAAGVDESLDGIPDFHAAVETLVSAAPVTEAARAMRDRLSDEDRQVLRETRAARDELVYDFFIDHPLLPPTGTPDAALVERARTRLGHLVAILDRARSLTDRLESDLAEPDGSAAR